MRSPELLMISTPRYKLIKLKLTPLKKLTTSSQFCWFFQVYLMEGGWEERSSGGKLGVTVTVTVTMTVPAGSLREPSREFRVSAPVRAQGAAPTKPALQTSLASLPGPRPTPSGSGRKPSPGWSVVKASSSVQAAWEGILADGRGA